MTITLIIPTSGREYFIRNIVNLLHHQLNDDVKLIVVSNGTLKQPLFFKELLFNPNITLLHSQEKSSSEPRNVAISNCNTQWIIFLDDDVKIDETFLPKVIEVIKSNQFDCFGGMYYPWYPEGKPEWLSTDFGEKKPLRADTGAIQLLEDGFLSAGIMAVKKEAIEKVGGFRVDLGMNDGIGYGEEDDFQLRLQVAGYRLGFVHDWYMHHAVLAHKHKVYWHLKSAYARGRDAQRIHKTYSKSIIRFKLVQVVITAFVKRAPLAIIQLFFKNKFYWQNAVLYTCQPIYLWMGRWKGAEK